MRELPPWVASTKPPRRLLYAYPALHGQAKTTMSRAPSPRAGSSTLHRHHPAQQADHRREHQAPAQAPLHLLAACSAGLISVVASTKPPRRLLYSGFAEPSVAFEMVASTKPPRRLLYGIGQGE